MELPGACPTLGQGTPSWMNTVARLALLVLFTSLVCIRGGAGLFCASLPLAGPLGISGSIQEATLGPEAGERLDRNCHPALPRTRVELGLWSCMHGYVPEVFSRERN